MSTRATIKFTGFDGIQAIIYQHMDGYPEGEHGVKAVLEHFFAANEDTYGRDTRYDDPSYLAARFVGFLYNTGHAEDGLGVGIVAEDPSDIAYTYEVICNGEYRPAVGTYAVI